MKKNILQKEPEKLKASYNKLKAGLTQEKKKKKNYFQKEAEKLEASYNEVCQIHAYNQKKLNTVLKEEKRMKNVLQEELEKLKASYQEGLPKSYNQPGEVQQRAPGGEGEEERSPKRAGEAQSFLSLELSSLRKRFFPMFSLIPRRWGCGETKECFILVGSQQNCVVVKEAEEVSGANIPQQLS
ncbi:unnamed protein product [Pleuronectes platessa]|uniref:Uncharacterized protein n=1 Tax=Pleuronectes platessa TaxID=8262 RepID=A0A9N7VFX0_PLEPL|nr:unnamed protein product [Pleuronectes platessa]